MPDQPHITPDTPPALRRMIESGDYHNMTIDWTQAPKTARWWAIDADGNGHWFLAPNVAAFTNFWFSEPVTAPTFGYMGDWKESLTERP